MRATWGQLAAVVGAGAVVGVAAGVLAPEGGRGLVVLVPAVLFAAVTVYALWRSRRPLSPVAVAPWWQYAWVLYFLSGLTWRVRGLSDIQQDVLDPAAIVRILLVAVVGLMLVAALASRRTSRSARGIGPLLALGFAYCGISLLSTLWSVQPFWTFYKSAEYGVGLMLAVFVLRSIEDEAGFRRLLWVTLAAYGSVLVSVWMGVLVAPRLAVFHSNGVIPFQIRGVFPSVASNGFGELGAIAGVVGVWLTTVPERKLRRWAFLVLTIALPTLVIAQARSAWLAFLGGTVLVIGLTRGARLVPLVAAAAGLVMSTEALDVVRAYVFRGQSLGMFMTLSGRLSYWTYAGSLLSKNPWLGLGAYAAGRFSVLAAVGTDTVSSVHNSFVEVAIGTGVIGLGVFVCLVVAAWMRLGRVVLSTRAGSESRAYIALVAGILALETIRAVFTSGSFIWHPAAKFLLVVVAIEWLLASARVRPGLEEAA